MHSADVIARALRLIEQGEGSQAVGRELGVPARTVRDWRAGRAPRYSPIAQADWAALHGPSYAYLFGLYLGDGWIASVGRTFSLRIFLDDRYPGIIAAAAAAMSTIQPRGHVRVTQRTGCSAVSSYWKQWPTVFPQHGAGRKHERHIALSDWQAAIAATHTRDFIGGLIHSDGSRFVANQRVRGKTYTYSRSNRSDDIRRIFCDHLDLLGIGWTQPNRWSIAIDRRNEVAKLDAFVGPKR